MTLLIILSQTRLDVVIGEREKKVFLLDKRYWFVFAMRGIFLGCFLHSRGFGNSLDGYIMLIVLNVNS